LERDEGMVVDVCSDCAEHTRAVCGLCGKEMAFEWYKGERWWYCRDCSETGYGWWDKEAK